MEMAIGLVGCGGIAHAHGQAAQRSERARLAACADVILARAQEYARQHQVPRAYASLEAMLEAESLDLVLLATWPALHLEQIRSACRLGARALLCEKSLALGGGQADEILQLVTEAGVFLMEAFMYRHHPQIRRAREWIEAGAVGEVGCIRGQFAFPVDPRSDNWRAKPELGGGTMMDEACYMVNALNHFAGGPPQEVFCKTVWYPPTGLDIGHAATLVYANGIIGQFDSNQRTCWREELQVCGSEGVLFIPRLLLNARWIELQRGDRVERHEFEPVDPYQLQLENVHDCLVGAGSPAVPLAESVRNLHTIDALLRSGRSGRVEEVS